MYRDHKVESNFKGKGVRIIDMYRKGILASVFKKASYLQSPSVSLASDILLVLDKTCWLDVGVVGVVLVTRVHHVDFCTYRPSLSLMIARRLTYSVLDLCVSTAG